MFTQEDRNHDGLLSTNETIEAFFKFDFNGDSRIQRNEYTCFQISDHPEIGNFANAVFDEYDHNNDSMLEDSDLLHFYHSMDINGDSLVEKQEFVDSWIKIFKRHEHYLLHGHVHPEHNPHACEQLDVG
ncbi:uncharacterized protein LOC135480930 [Liolophura sinensis]|uniref:uncharacterized protein LOC135480930 n=1 Tax=Liolophura sinensis TaxID=3198878 RepID=UPI0031590A1F